MFVSGADDDATTCAFLRGEGGCEVNRTAVKIFVYFKHSETNIPLRFKENSFNLNFYYFNCWFTRSNSEIHYKKTPTGHRACAKNNYVI